MVVRSIKWSERDYDNCTRCNSFRQLQAMERSQETNTFVKHSQVMKWLAMIAGDEIIATHTSDEMAYNDCRR